VMSPRETTTEWLAGEHSLLSTGHSITV
jgi:hypothetical protein